MSQSPAQEFHRSVLDRPVWWGQPGHGMARACVTNEGRLQITGDSMSAPDALALAAWIVATFEDPT